MDYETQVSVPELKGYRITQALFLYMFVGYLACNTHTSVCMYVYNNLSFY